ncbi:Apocarotenoid-15,15'-oxygenase [Acaryochloris thomasi RCC1774]|uniref:Apocarotenoid-15,15'-oxygenase n=2 Tax=Acaryochloris TaxID=155977 RepID=A0A2W1JP06_9CYAN|nr:Apocarotenoid-15,15'-oxygenase [Acaryochloris thomasi RCC1774]
MAQPAVEFGPTPLRVIEGQIPAGLRGTLYRNGPGRLQRSGQYVDHWFDGDGAILAVHFTEAGAIGLYRYVQTQEFQTEEQANQYLYSGYGQLAPGPFWKRWGSQPKNAANTSVLALPDKLLALWEGGNPYALDLETLETHGLDDLGSLKATQTYSAHPKRDPQTSDLYNFGIIYGPRSYIQLYRSDASGQILQQGKVALDRVSLIHDFVLSGPYLVFLMPPVVLKLIPIVFGTQSFSDALQWQPQYGTQIVVVDRKTLKEVTRIEADPWFQWHIGNGFQANDGSVVIDYVRYPNFDTNQWLKEVVSGCPTTPAAGHLWRLRLDPVAGKVVANEQQLDLECEFPITPMAEVGRQHPSLYLSCQSQRLAKVEENFDSVAHFNLETGQLTLATFASGCYPIEPIHVSHPDDPSQSWMLTVVFDGNRDQSTVQIFNAQCLDAGPLCILELPEVVPIGFHGTWRPQ